MSLQGTDLALVSARICVARIGAFRLGFYPDDVEGTGTVGPGEYAWQEIKPEDDGQEWDLMTPWSMCATPPVASFISNEPTVLGNTTAFTDTSTPVGEITFWHWLFGDGAESDEQNPTHVYPAIGTYTVVLYVSSPRGASSASGTVHVVAPPPPGGPLAGFYLGWQQQHGETANTDAAFVDDSWAGPNPPITYDWDFGDGSLHSSDSNPVHEYIYSGSDPQTFTVTLIVTDALLLTDSVSHDVQINFHS